MRCGLMVSLMLLSCPVFAKHTVIVVVGAAGTSEYGREFAAWSDRWHAAVKQAEGDFISIGLKPDEFKDRDHLQQVLAEQSRPSQDALWLVLIGHGTFDGQTPRFNLRGPDVTAAELAAWLQSCERPMAVINCASASGAFLAPLSAPGRIVITATKSGHETNYCRFGGYLSAAIGDPGCDLDKDGQTSLLEAYLMASRQTAEFYKSDARLATEHALLDDTGDGLGTAAECFRGVRATRVAQDGAKHDGTRAHQFALGLSAADRELTAAQIARRNELELALSALRSQKAQLDADDYYNQLEILLVEMAQLYHKTTNSPDRSN